MKDKAIGSLYEKDFPALLTSEWKPWREAYLGFVGRIQSASREEWMTPAFQQELWESADLGGVGMGTSVVLTTAYADPAIAAALWRARELVLPSDVARRAEAIVAVFEEVLGLVTPKHNDRRPSAKLVRALVGIFPRDLLCLLDSSKTNRVRQELELKKHGEHFLQQHLRIRQQLSVVVGEEPGTLEGAVERSMFAWLLWERGVQAEEEQANPGAAASLTSTVGEPAQAPEPGQPAAPALRLWPRDKQWAGAVHVKNALLLLLAIVRDAEHGATRADLIANVQEAASYLSASSAGKQVALARGPFPLLEQHDGGVMRPTDAGRELLEGESASDVLTPLLLRRVWGAAQVLDLLRRSPAGMVRAELVSAVTRRHGAWTTDMAASAILEWCKDLDLVESSSAPGDQLVLRLSDSGLEWASRVPADLGAWDGAPAPVDDAEELAAILPMADAMRREFLPTSFEDLAKALAADAVAARLVFPEDLLALLYGALHALEHKRFVLLSGLSGTGKTSLAEAFGRAYCSARRIAQQTHMLRVPVSPDWSDPSGLLGYVSPLGAEPTFQATQALELLLRAHRYPQEPFFLCLDEMNLARVEHYFAPFLSAMEGAASQLVIHGSRDVVDNVPASMPWPKNLFILGTVNMDETTHAFSDKVLDRAFSFELWDVNLAAWEKSAAVNERNVPVLDNIMPALTAVHEALRPARRHFGYRTCDEILGFCSAVPAAARAQALDAAVLAKVLPKLRGDDSGALPKALEDAEKVCADHGLTRSKAKLVAMRESLKSLGVVRFAS